MRLLLTGTGLLLTLPVKHRRVANDLQDPTHHRFHVGEHFQVAKPENTKTHGVHGLVASQVLRLAALVSVAVHLDDERCGRAEEVSDEAVGDHVLVPEENL